MTPEPLILDGDAIEHRIDDLLFRGAEGDSDLAALVGEHLRPEHTGIGDADESVVTLGFSLGDDEEPGAIGRAVDVGLLNMLVDLLFLLWQHDEVEFRGRRQRLDEIFQRVVIDAVVQVKGQRRDLGVGEEQWFHAALGEIIGHRDII